MVAFALHWELRSMQAPELDRLARDLEAIGAAPSIICRTLQELEDHLADAELAARQRGLTQPAAQREAAEALGDLRQLVAQVALRPRLLVWRRRWPVVARCLHSVSYCLLWPVSPLVYVAAHPADAVRWGLSSSIALCITASLLLSLQWLMQIAVPF